VRGQGVSAGVALSWEAEQKQQVLEQQVRAITEVREVEAHQILAEVEVVVLEQ
jgi:hypothetical protein